MILTAETQTQLRAIIAGHPRGPLVPADDFDLGTPVHDLSVNEKEGVWLALLDLSQYLLVTGRGPRYDTTNATHLPMMAALGSVTVPLAEVPVHQFRVAYQVVNSVYDRPIRALYYFLANPALPVLGLLRWLTTTEVMVVPGLPALEAIFRFCLRVRAGERAPTPFFDAGIPLAGGQRFQHGGQTFEVSFEAGVPRFVVVSYPQPEPGQTWTLGTEAYLIAVGGHAVRLSDGTLTPLEDGALPGSVRGQTFVRTR